MSGGSFNNCGYVYYQVYQFADELENKIENNSKPEEYGYSPQFSEETLNYLREQIPALKKISEIMRAIDYLYSGDHGEDSFFKKIKEIEED